MMTFGLKLMHFKVNPHDAIRIRPKEDLVNPGFG